ncbi:transcriptional regulator [Treponema ruminis]|uniref:TrpR family trp operon transcriptional repressor n=1 Tax=Treponema ruminis TaxID=744515 RepID=A0A7W8LLV8_9SPIR|nr:Trp family transcriptional regulator [Treponema ruminis]MBB5225887.1 TrpR family trp operon transcriptional repressor [Treponema ruminis]QSI03200.1 transcriptional regulator [Treponema ruminis]
MENTENTEELSSKDLEGALREMCKLLSKNNDADFIYEFFGCLFTPAEMNDFAKRWLLVREIDKGTTQREIARKFHISLCKITRGSRELKKDDSAFRKLLDYADNL